MSHFINHILRFLFVSIIIICFTDRVCVAYLPQAELMNKLSKENDSKAIVDIYNEIGWNYIFSQPDSGQIYFTKALELATRTQNNKGIGISLSNLALYYSQIGDFQNSGNCLARARIIGEEVGDLEMLYKIYSAIANNYIVINLNSKAREYIQKCYEINTKLKKEYNASISMVALGITYLNDGNYSKARECVERVRNIITKYRNSPLEFNFYLAEAEILSVQNNDIAALCYLDTAQKIAVKTGNLLAKSDCEIRFAEIYFNRNELKKSLIYAKSALTKAEGIQYNEVKMSSFKLLGKIYQKMGDNRLANTTFIKYDEIRDSLFNSSVINQLHIIQSQYEFDKSQTEINKNKFEKQLQINTVAARDKFIVFLIAFILIVLVLSYLLFRAYRNLQLDSRELNNRNEEITKISQTLEVQNDKLEKLNSTKDKFLSIIGHDLRNPIGGIKSLSTILLNKDYNWELNDVMEVIKSIDKAALNTYTLLDNLLQWAQTQSSGSIYTPDSISLTKVIERNIDLIKHSISQKEITIFYIPKEHHVVGDFNYLDTILRNLLSNAVKFTRNGGKIKLEISEILNGQDDLKYFQVSVIDDGIGMSKNSLDNLFLLGMQKSTKGTNNESGSGLGLILCKEFVERMGGRIWVESEEGKGSKFSFTLLGA